MPEAVNSLIRNAGRLATLPNDIVANIVDGAQLGYGNHLPMVDAATPLVMPMIVPVVTHSPTMFRNLPGYDDVLKALVERHAKSIEGIDFGYQLEGNSVPAGHDGQNMFMPTATKRTQVNPSFTWPELTGMLVWNFVRNWITMIKDPDTQAATSAALTVGLDTIDPQLMSTFSMDVLFLQFDTTLRSQNLLDAYFVTNMWPQETGMAGFSKNVGESKMQERSITFYGVVQHNRNTKAIGRMVAEILGLHRVDFNLAVPVAQQIHSRLQNKGVQKEIQEAMSTFQAIG